MNKFKVEAAELLEKNELKSVLGGNPPGECCLSWDHAGYTDCGWDYGTAKGMYDDKVVNATTGETVTGYCCTSCP